MQRTQQIINSILIIGLIAGILSACTRDRETIHYFYETVCPSCEAARKMEEISTHLLVYGRNRKDADIFVYDIYKTSGALETFQKLLQDRKTDEHLAPPVLITQHQVFTGITEVEEFLKSLGILERGASE